MEQNKINFEELNMLFLKLAAWFPSFKPDKMATAAWLDELKDYSAVQITSAVKALGVKSESNFAPNLFQIVAELEKANRPTFPLAATVWEDVLQICRGQMHKTVTNIECLPEAANIALRSVGGTDAIGFVQMESLPFIRREFIQIYESCIDSGKLAPMPILAAPKKQSYALGGGFSPISKIMGELE